MYVCVVEQVLCGVCSHHVVQVCLGNVHSVGFIGGCGVCGIVLLFCKVTKVGCIEASRCLYLVL